MKRGSPLHRHDPALTRELLTWFASQTAQEILLVIQAKRERFHKITRQFPRLSPAEAEVAALLEVCEEWSADVKHFASSRAMTPEALARMSRRRTARAKNLAVHHSGAKQWLNRNWGKIVELKNTGNSFRVIARCLQEECNVCISHTTIRNYWLQWNTHE